MRETAVSLTLGVATHPEEENGRVLYLVMPRCRVAAPCQGPGAGGAAGVPAPAARVPDGAGGRAVRAGRRGSVRGPAGDVAGAAVPGARVPARPRRALRCPGRRAGR